MKRLLNPKRHATSDFLLGLPIIEHNKMQFRKWIRDESYNMPTSCQCYGDCSCHLDYGKLVVKFTIYYRNVNEDGTDRAFYTDIDYIPIHRKEDVDNQF